MDQTPGITWKKTQFFEDHCEDSGAHIAYSSIKSLEYFRIRHETTTNFVIKDTDHSASLTVNVDGLPPIKLFASKRSGILDTFRDSEADADAVGKVYAFIAPRTFEQRLTKYLVELKDLGYFTYDGKRFHADGTVRDGDRVANVHAFPLRRAPFALAIQGPPPQKKPGWKGLVSSLTGASNDIALTTLVDEDCFLALLKSMYGALWVRMDHDVFGGTRNFWNGGKAPPAPTTDLSETPPPGTDDGPEVESLMKLCGQVASRMAGFVEPRVKAGVVRFGHGYEVFGKDNLELVEREAQRSVPAACWSFALGVVTLNSCVKNPAFPSSETYSKLKVRTLHEIYRRMADPFPVGFFKLFGDEMNNTVGRAAAAPVMGSLAVVQKCAEALNGRAEYPLFGLYKAFAEQTGLGDPEDRDALVRAFDDFAKKLLFAAVSQMGIPLGKASAER